MKLVFYSGGNNDQNAFLHTSLARLVGDKEFKSFTYIPFCADGAAPYYRQAVARYKKFGFTDFMCLHVDKPIDDEKLEKALASDVIYLAGGNTFYLMHHLRRSQLISKLRAFAKNDGVIAGLSAGGIILTPTVGLAGYPLFDRDENEVELKSLKSLGLVKFEFFPHYVPSARIKKAIMAYSRLHNISVLACTDGSGIVVANHATQFIGNVFLFEDGVCTQVSER